MLRSEKSPITSKRINFINEYLTYEIYKYKSRGLYETHKYMFVLLLTLKIDLERSTITHEEFQNFIKGGAALDLNTCPPKPAKWITDMTWLNLVELSNLRHYQYIVQQVRRHQLFLVRKIFSKTFVQRQDSGGNLIRKILDILVF